MNMINAHNPKPLYLRLKEFILTQVANGAYKPGDKLPSQSQFREQFGMSVGTVRRVLYELAQEGILHTSQGKGVFIADPVPVGKKRTKKSIGFVYSFNQTHGPYLSKLLEAVTSHCNSLGYELKVYGNDSLNTSLREAVSHRLAAGFLLASPPDMELVKLIQQDGIAFVCVNNQVTDKDPNCVTADGIESMRKAVAHLAELGHKKIGFLSGPETWAVPRIMETFEQVLSEHGLRCYPKLVRHGEWEQETGYRLMKEILAGDPKPTAVIATDDQIGVGAIRAAWEKNLRVPEDLSVVAIGNMVPAHLQPIPLTVVDIHLEEIGQLSVRMLADIIEHHQLPQRILVPPELITGKTSMSPGSSKRHKTGADRQGVRNYA